MVTAIASAAAAQRDATEEISANIEQIAAITQATAAGAKESAKAVHELSTLAMDLQAMVGKFKVSWAAADQAQDQSQYDHAQYEKRQYSEPPSEPWLAANGPFLPGEAEGELVDASYSEGDDAFSASAR